jgi:hypothetical protein
MNSGYVYCMSSPSHYDTEAREYLYKIGRSCEPSKRLREMNRKATHVPAPFVIHFAKWVRDAPAVEKMLHMLFKDRRYRAEREFFAVPLKEIKEAFVLIDGTWHYPDADAETEEDEAEEREPRYPFRKRRRTERS